VQGLVLGAATGAPGISGTSGYTLTPVFDTKKLSGSDLLPVSQIINKPLVDYDGVKRPAKGHFITAVDSTMFSVYPPIQGCGYGLTTTSNEARYRGCSVAMNAGFFDISNKTHPHCLGGVVSDNVLIEHETTGSVHFGLTDDGNWFIGYLDNEFLNNHTLASVADRCDSTGPCQNDADLLWYFRDLVSGQVQLVNNGKNYVNESSGVNTFTTEVSGRTAIGVLKGGRLGLVQIDGATGQDGIDLFTLADMMVQLGFIQAINLDGGGSSDTSINGVLVSSPSDRCAGDSTGLFGCERAVSTIVCLHSSPQQLVVGAI
jgi:N-acetylglucosamine-1-phosphodiester alpha-N-acetylglucosaminidase